MNKPSTKPVSEFYDLSERLLNSGDLYWGNLGYWPIINENSKGYDYSTACEALARYLANILGLGSENRIFDAGFGCGDQLLLWLNVYNVEFIGGINYSVIQTELAKSRLEENRILFNTEYLIQGSVGDLKKYTQFYNKKIDTVVALDCAYHFPSRRAFLEDSYCLLKNNLITLSPKKGMIGLTDIVLGEANLTWGKNLLLNIMLGLSRIPRVNIITMDEYRKELGLVGFENVLIEDISEHVFMPFSQWIKSNRRWIKASSSMTGRRTAWLKYKVTAAFLAWAYKHSVLRYVVVKAEYINS